MSIPAKQFFSKAARNYKTLQQSESSSRSRNSRISKPPRDSIRREESYTKLIFST